MGLVAVLLLSTSYFLLPAATHAAVWHCASCECNCNTRVTSSVTIEAPYTGDSTDPESVCVASCRTACGLPPDVTGVPQNFTGRGVSCTIVSAAAPAAPAASAPSAAPAAGPITLYNPLGAETDVPAFIARGIRGVLGVVGAIALLMFVYGGIIWMTAGGEAKAVDGAKHIIKNAVIGLLLIFFSYNLIGIFFSFFRG